MITIMYFIVSTLLILLCIILFLVVFNYYEQINRINNIDLDEKLEVLSKKKEEENLKKGEE